MTRWRSETCLACFVESGVSEPLCLLSGGRSFVGQLLFDLWRTLWTVRGGHGVKEEEEGLTGTPSEMTGQTNLMSISLPTHTTLLQHPHPLASYLQAVPPPLHTLPPSTPPPSIPSHAHCTPPHPSLRTLCSVLSGGRVESKRLVKCRRYICLLAGTQWLYSGASPSSLLPFPSPSLPLPCPPLSYPSPPPPPPLPSSPSPSPVLLSPTLLPLPLPPQLTSRARERAVPASRISRLVNFGGQPSVVDLQPLAL